jgi:hypothetical protein
VPNLKTLRKTTKLKVQLLSQQSHTVSPEFECFLQSPLLTCISVANRNSAKLIWLVPYLDCPSVSSSHVSENRHSNYARFLSPPRRDTCPFTLLCFLAFWSFTPWLHRSRMQILSKQTWKQITQLYSCTGTIESQLQSILRSRTLLLKNIGVTMSWLLEHNFPPNSVHMGKRYV